MIQGPPRTGFFAMDLCVCIVPPTYRQTSHISSLKTVSLAPISVPPRPVPPRPTSTRCFVETFFFFPFQPSFRRPDWCGVIPASTLEVEFRSVVCRPPFLIEVHQFFLLPQTCRVNQTVCRQGQVGQGSGLPSNPASLADDFFPLSLFQPYTPSLFLSCREARPRRYIILTEFP